MEKVPEGQPVPVREAAVMRAGEDWRRTGVARAREVRRRWE